MHMYKKYDCSLEGDTFNSHSLEIYHYYTNDERF